MTTYPTTPRAAFLQWCQAHAPVWTANAAAIGLTPAQATTFDTQTDALAAAMLAQEQAKQAYRVATQEVEGAYDTLRATTGDDVRLIRAYAESQSKPDIVYNTAQIPPPAQPSPVPPPGQPTDLTVTLAPSTGDLTLRWKCTNPPGAAGTSYIIRRRLPGESEFTFLGVSGKKEFVDATLVAGPDSVQYTVQGQRADTSGPVSAIFLVNFGQAPGGGFTATVTSGGYAPSTVDGRTVQKVLPNTNGSLASRH